MHQFFKKAVVDFLGLVVGSSIGYGVALSFGLDFNTQSYNLSGIAGIALVGLSGGFGLQAARKWRSRSEPEQKP